MLVKYFIDVRDQGREALSRINKKSLSCCSRTTGPETSRLQNVIERSVSSVRKEFAVDEHWLARGPVATGRESEGSTSICRRGEEMIEAALAETGGKVAGPSGAAVTLGMPATTLYSKIKSDKIDKRASSGLETLA